MFIYIRIFQENSSHIRNRTKLHMELRNNIKIFNATDRGAVDRLWVSRVPPLHTLQWVFLATHQMTSTVVSSLTPR